MAKIELLAPAKNLESGIIAINYGADAVYIGAPKFGARSSAGNSMDDIKSLIEYAHKFWAKVYITMNTIIYEDELQEAEDLIHELYKMGADALIVQDMAILELNLPPIALHASTQTHNYDIERIKFLEQAGFERIILARELSEDQLKEIRENTESELEYFVNGALCVSMSGQCYFSHYTTGRSANRGECSQACRMKYNLVNSEGRVYSKEKYLLSLKDLNLSDELSNIVDAGICSLKIEGRLKDISYIKNIVSLYRKKIDEIIYNDIDDNFEKASSGNTTISFTPDADRTFNRGFTKYFFGGRTNDIANYYTPKSMGKKIGVVKKISENSFEIRSDLKISNGDGLCFLDKKKSLKGMQINNVEGKNIFPNEMPNIHVGAILYRNNDHQFTKILKQDRSSRKIGVGISIYQADKDIIIVAQDDDYNQATYTLNGDFEISKNTEMAENNFKKQFSKMGDSIFCLNDIFIELEDYPFIPAKQLNNIRRDILNKLEEQRLINYPKQDATKGISNPKYFSTELSYMGNVVNSKSREFYTKCGVEKIEKGLELQKNLSEKLLMVTRHCLRHDFKMCLLDKKCKEESKLDLFIVDINSKKYKLKFDCKRCEMKIFSSK